MKHTNSILIVDDMKVNRSILSRMLSSEYSILEAEDGEEAMSILKEQCGSISIVLLDLIMPKLNGHEVLKQMQADELLSTIPVIVISGASDAKVELECLTEGATEFIQKPFYSEIVKNRVASIIRLRENTSILEVLEYDKLTNVYTKEFFLHEARNYIDKNPDEEYTIVCTDIENFRVVNEVYGVKKGDELLKYLATKHREKSLELGGICGRFASNTFVMLFRRFKERWDQDKSRKYVEERYSDSPVKPLVLKFGLYDVIDKSAEITSMCDRAVLALNSIKNKYGLIAAWYDENMRQQLLKRQIILDSMELALSSNQFQVYFQPKHDIVTGRVAGAEALVRWSHSKFGFLSPGDFIPLFEANGFIYKLDYYVWQETCKCLAKWKNEGRELFPVSINVSRADFSQLNLVEVINKLVEKYDIPASVLHLEITESAYTGNPQHIIETVEELRSCGFKIEMDDFGSGYSSLNMLSDMPIDFLKIDMQFMQKHKNGANNRSILSFIVSLSKWLGLPTIAEGVETEEDFQLLKAMGCNYVQGYYFAKPMCQSDFERYISTPHIHVDRKVIAKTFEQVRDLPEFRSKTVLVVEDIPMNLETLKVMLEPYYFVKTAINGEDALKIMKDSTHGEISCVLLDLMMPVMDGFELLKLMHQSPMLDLIPVIITSEAGQDSELKALRLGAANFLPKPYQKEILLHQVRTAMDSAELYCIKNNIKLF